MKRLIHVMVMATCLAAMAARPVAAQQTAGDTEGVLMARQFTGAGDQQMNYWLYLPQGYESQEQWPLVLFLHGAGERGTDLEIVKRHGPPRLVAAGRQFPFVLVAPQASQRGGWSPDLLNALLDDVGRQHRIDERRVYVTGLSMGGGGTWNLAASNPKRFAAIAPVCARGNVDDAPTLAHLPIWMYHGAHDATISVEQSERMYAALKAAGAEHVGMTIYPDTGHDSWTATYNNPQFYEWLLQQRRPPRAHE